MLTLALIVPSCVEEFEVETEDFESILVVEALITNESKHQEILISRTFKLEENGPLPVSNADVRIVDDLGTEYEFTEIESGRYGSTTMFAGETGRSYTLQITTDDGKSYASDAKLLTSPSQIDDVYAETMVNDDGVSGIGIFVDGSSSASDASFYRYSYQETYKIIAPIPITGELEIIDDDPFIVNVVGMATDRVCYATNTSNEILIANTADFENNRVKKYLIKFFPSDAFPIRTRYSIMLNQLVQSEDGYNFYKLLDKFSDLENLFSQAQPGFIPGNIQSTNSDDRVIGLFEVSTITNQRLFFNYDDFFPDNQTPPYVDNCELISPGLIEAPGANPYLFIIQAIESDDLLYYLPNDNPQIGEGPYIFVNKICGDCTELGTPIVPDFWVD